MMLPSDSYTTKKRLAEFYMVPEKTVETATARHRSELDSDGYKVLSIKEFCDLHYEGHKLADMGISPKARSLALYNKRCALRLGMVLRDSPVAKQVRTYLLDMEAHSSQISQQTLMQMANQVASNAVQLSAQSSQLTKHAAILERNATELVYHSRLIVAMIGEINRNREDIHKLKVDMEKRFAILENPQDQIGVEYATPGQLDTLRAKIKEKAAAEGLKTVSLWKKLNRHFGITRYMFLPKERFREALDWLESYPYDN